MVATPCPVTNGAYNVLEPTDEVAMSADERWVEIDLGEERAIEVIVAHYGLWVSGQDPLPPPELRIELAAAGQEPLHVGDVGHDVRAVELDQPITARYVYARGETLLGLSELVVFGPRE